MKANAVILRDTLMDIANTPLDTFGPIPKFIFIARRYNGELAKSFTGQSLFSETKNKGYGIYFTVDGVSSSKNVWAYNTSFQQGKEYNVTFIWTDGLSEKREDLKTIFLSDSLNKKTYVYEIATGLASYTFEGEIIKRGKFTKEEKAKLENFFYSQPIEYFFRSEREYSKFRKKCVELLGLKNLLCLLYLKPNKD